MYNVFPATRKSLDPIGAAQSIDGAKRTLGRLLNVFNGMVALPAHWHHQPSVHIAVITSLATRVQSIFIFGTAHERQDMYHIRENPEMHNEFRGKISGKERAVAGTGEVMCSEGGDAGQQPSVKVAMPNIVAT